jgi:glycosyltransferase involved in cell wall biosynthesis
LKILYFHQHFTTPDGSSGTRSYEFAKALIARGHQVTMVCGRSDRSGLNLPYNQDRGWHQGRIDGIDVIALPLGYSNKDGIAKRLITFTRFACKSVVIALREECDLVFATSTPLTAAIPGIAARWFRGKPFVFEVRDLWPELPRAMGMKNPLLLGGMWILEGLAYRASSACIGLAPGIVEGITRRSTKGHPVALIPNGCDLELFHPSLRAAIDLPGILPGDFVAGFTGAHGRANGLDAILDAAAVLKRRGDPRVKILLVGDGSEKPRLQARAKAEGLDNVLFHAPMPKRKLAVLTASLGCGLMTLDNIPAFYHGTSPNKFFDYIAAGIPVVNNYPGWLADMIEKNQFGMAVRPGSAELLADALADMANNSVAADEMGKSARKFAEDSFNRGMLAVKFVHTIESSVA